ncbi:MAG: RluA family pseudouridine synthase [Alphaproteobacteria bacterium]|nr:RluA family pseudouridine synthase [Alphaproteobacteria bacterium]
MSIVQIIPVAAEDGDIRLDRWFKRHFPALGHGRLEKLLRTGQVRIDGKRARAGDRVAAGQSVRVPPLGTASGAPDEAAPRPMRERDAAAIRAAVLHRDDDVIAIDKPAGLAVQGGTGTTRHLDAMLDALRFEAAERPRLVHRLDKDTSGVLLLARSASAAAKLAAAFRDKAARKTYWALVVGVPRPDRGRIDLPLAKQPGTAGEKMTPGADGSAAVTYYAVVEEAGTKAAFLALMPITGRTHQLRAHCAAIGTPILGDGKYGGAGAHLAGVPGARALHLHARSIALPHPQGGTLRVEAPLPPHMRSTWRFFGFPQSDGDPFAALAGERR